MRKTQDLSVDKSRLKGHFLCVLQTHSLGDSQGFLGKRRYCGADKPEITRRCTESLVASMNNAQTVLPGFSFELHVFDDHSDAQSIQHLQKALSRAAFLTRFTALESRGIMPSVLACYEYGRDHGKDLVYFAQDDYLFCESAIEEMIVFKHQASAFLGAPVSVYPFNDPFRYLPVNNHELVRIVQGEKRHWRTNYHTASCFMTHIDIIKRNWELFYNMGASTTVHGDIERDTINQLWQKRSYYLFSPLPSIALHLQYDTEKDPYLDWRAWWDTFDTADARETYQLPPGKKILVNVGCGKTPLDIKLLREPMWTEVRVDSDPEAMPHIVADMQNMPMLPAQSADVLWASHVLEHIFWHEIPIVIREFRRILKDESIAIISVPDLQTAAAMIAEDKSLNTMYESDSGPIAPLDMVYGCRAFTRLGVLGMQHKTGFTRSTLEIVLKDLGFAYVICSRSDFGIRAFASNSPLTQGKMDAIL